MTIPHTTAIEIVLRLLADGINGANVLALYIDQQSERDQFANLTDREMSYRAWKRSDEACGRLAVIERRLGR
ncbi:hypothetical protein VH567_07925 [Sphingomonas sp. 4RDLI-65]